MATSKKRIDKTSEELLAFIKTSRQRAKKSPFLKKRKKVICCNSKSELSDRAKYGTCRCDSYSMVSRLPVVISNYLYQYLADAQAIIKREDWTQIEACAMAFREYAEADNWDLLSKDTKVKRAYKSKEREFKNAMNWMIKNWQSLWW